MSEVMKLVADIDVGKIASELVAIPSYSHMERQEEKVAAYIVDFFEKQGIDVKRQWVGEGRPNVVARIPGGDGPGLMLTGHMDTVPPYDMKDPFSGAVVDGRLHGRGACDMKGPLAAMMAAMAAVHKSGERLGGDLYFAAVVDEEEKGTGVEALIRQWPDVKGVVVGEPTDLAIGLGHKGLEWITIDVLGKKTHSGNLKGGVNAITMAGRLIHYLEEEYGKVLALRVHPILGESTINIGTISGGDQPSTVPDNCKLVLDRRFLPMETREQVYRELVSATDELKERYPGFEATVANYFKEEETLPHLPFCLGADAPLVTAATETMLKLGMETPAVESFSAWTDGGMIHSQTHTDCIIMGPGKLDLAHSASESIAVEELRKAAAIYAGIGLTFGQKK